MPGEGVGAYPVFVGRHFCGVGTWGLAFQQGAVPTWDLVPMASGAFLRERSFRRNPRDFLVSVL